MRKVISILLSLAVLLSGIISLDFSAKEVKAVNENTVRGFLNYNKDATNQYGVKSFASDATADTMMVLDMTKKSGDRTTMGTSSNPFMILELVPWQGFGKMGYMIEGCEPVDIYTRAGCYSEEKAVYYRSIGKEDTYNSYLGTTGGLSWVNSGAVVKECFADEDYPGKGFTKKDEENPDYLYRWFHATGSKTIKGYYEKITGTSVEGNFNISGVDSSGRPIFTKTEFGKGEFIWVSLGGEAPNYDFHAQKENKPDFAADASLATVKSAYASGDREYTTRTDDEYWFMPNCSQVDEDGTVYDNLIPKSKFVHYNDFLRYTLRIRTIEEIEMYSIVVKSVEPTQLRDHPEYIDYADLIWIHSDSETGIYKYEENANDYEVFRKDEKTGANENSSFFDDNNDIGWEVAEKLYFKANGLTKYSYKADGTADQTLIDYSGDNRFAYAPVVMDKTLMDEAEDEVSHNDVSYFLNYDEMTLNKSYSGGNKGSENNFYKFCLMNTLMDQDVFYNLFYTPLASTHQPVIRTIAGQGYNTIQEGDAQSFWCPEAFLPYVKGVTEQTGWDTDAGRTVLDRYKITYYNGSFMNFPAEAVFSYSYIYNSGNEIFTLGSNDSFGREEEFTSGVYEWFDSLGEGKDPLSSMDVVFFLLHYQKVRKPLSSEPDPTQIPTATEQPAVSMKPAATKQPSVSQQKKKPAKVVGLSIKAKQKKVTVSWKKKSGAAGYQIQYAINKKFTRQKKSMNVRSHTGIIRGLKRNKAYYIRVRAYTRVSGKKIYGKWSKVKKVKIK